MGSLQQKQRSKMRRDKLLRFSVPFFIVAFTLWMVVTAYQDQGVFGGGSEADDSQAYTWNEIDAKSPGEDTLVLDVGPAKVTIHAGSRFLVEELDTRGIYAIYLRQGAVTSKVRKLAEGEGYEIRTPNSVAGVRGTEFTVWYGDRYYRKSEVFVVEGLVLVMNENGETILVGPLQRIRVIESHPPARVTKEDSEYETYDDRYGEIQISSFSKRDASKPDEAEDTGSSSESAKPGEKKSDEKVTICHVPPGNPTNPVTITIARSALEMHLSHGDAPGACMNSSGKPGGAGGEGGESGGQMTLTQIIALPDIVAAYKERYGDAHKRELMNSYRKLQGRSAVETASRADLNDLERMILGKMMGAYSSGFQGEKAGGAVLETDYKRYDAKDTDALKDLYKKDYTGTGFGDPDLLKNLGQ